MWGGGSAGGNAVSPGVGDTPWRAAGPQVSPGCEGGPSHVSFASLISTHLQR